MLVDLGDTTNWDSLSFFPKLPNQVVPQLYEEIKAEQEALALLKAGLGRHKCEQVYCLGNHEYRFDRFLNEHELLKNVLYHPADREGWNIIPYKESFSVDYCTFTHCILSGNGQPMSGATVTSRIAKLLSGGNTLFFGHHHRFEIHTVPGILGEDSRAAVSCPCAHYHQDEAYARGLPSIESPGILLIDTDYYPVPGITFIPMAQLEESYGEPK